jgi:hypothetical protein
VIVAAVLLIIAAWQIWEARKFRLESIRPALSVRPARYIPGGHFVCLELVNDGGLARNLKIELICDGVTSSMLTPSLGRNDKLRLMENTDELFQKGGNLLVRVSYSDTYGKRHQENLEVDFGQLKKQRESPYVSNRLDTLAESLHNIGDRLSR